MISSTESHKIINYLISAASTGQPWAMASTYTRYVVLTGATSEPTIEVSRDVVARHPNVCSVRVIRISYNNTIMEPAYDNVFVSSNMTLSHEIFGGGRPIQGCLASFYVHQPQGRISIEPLEGPTQCNDFEADVLSISLLYQDGSLIPIDGRTLTIELEVVYDKAALVRALISNASSSDSDW